MSVYVIAEIEVTDPDGYAKYAPLANESVLRHGGRFVVRGGPTAGASKGSGPAGWSSSSSTRLDAAQAWYHSDDYQAALPIRLGEPRAG